MKLDRIQKEAIEMERCTYISCYYRGGESVNYQQCTNCDKRGNRCKEPTWNDSYRICKTDSETIKQLIIELGNYKDVKIPMSILNTNKSKLTNFIFHITRGSILIKLMSPLEKKINEYYDMVL